MLSPTRYASYETFRANIHAIAETAEYLDQT